MNTSNVSDKFISFIENLGIPIDEKNSNNSVIKLNNNRIFSAQRTRPESIDPSFLNSPTMLSDGQSSLAKNKDYKSNAIAYRIAKKQIEGNGGYNRSLGSHRYSTNVNSQQYRWSNNGTVVAADNSDMPLNVYSVISPS